LFEDLSRAMAGRRPNRPWAIRLWVIASVVGFAVGVSMVASAAELTTSPVTRVWVGSCGGFAGIASIDYEGGSSGYLAGSYGGVAPLWCQAQTVPPGSQYSIPLFLHSNDLEHNHQIVGLVSQPPFKLIALSPGLPAQISAGGNATFNLTLLVPEAGGTYVPAVALTAI
jgi:hypothetical protein